MSGDLRRLPKPVGSYLCSVSFWRQPDGSVRPQLEKMPVNVMRELPGEPHQKLRVAADWLTTGAASFLLLANALVPPEGDES